MPRLDSSAIRRVTYNPKTQKMNVKFVGTGKQYTYVGVPEDVYDDFIDASSAGQFFNDNIKDDYIAVPSEFVSSVRFDRPNEDEFYESTDLMELGLNVLTEQRSQDWLDRLGTKGVIQKDVTKDVSSAILKDTGVDLYPFTTRGQGGLPVKTPGEDPRMLGLRMMQGYDNMVRQPDGSRVYAPPPPNVIPSQRPNPTKYTKLTDLPPGSPHNPGGQGAMPREPFTDVPPTTDPIKYMQQFNKANPKNLKPTPPTPQMRPSLKESPVALTMAGFRKLSDMLKNARGMAADPKYIPREVFRNKGQR